MRELSCPLTPAAQTDRPRYFNEELYFTLNSGGIELEKTTIIIE